VQIVLFNFEFSVFARSRTFAVRFVTMSTTRFECILTWRENEETRPAELSLGGGHNCTPRQAL